LLPLNMRLASIIPTFTAGGIGPVCRYTAEAIARQGRWAVTLVSLHDPPSIQRDAATGLNVVSLGLDVDTAAGFMSWLAANPQDVVITSNVSGIEPAYPYFPTQTVHIEQIHDSARRYRGIATRHAQWLDGVTCVGQHFEPTLRKELAETGSKALLRAVHNGAAFPPPLPRHEAPGQLRLLFVGRIEPQKGAFDMPALLSSLMRSGVPAHLTIAGGRSDALRKAFDRRGVGERVTWVGRVPHAECYRLAAEADVLLVLSRKEAFGMVTIEGMCMGCVPVAYDIHSGSTEIIEHGMSGLLVKPGSISRLATAIAALHTDRETLRRLSTGAISRARTAFGVETTAANMTAFIEDVVANAQAHPSKRLSGSPAATGHSAVSPPQRGYQRLPVDWRLAAHRVLCRFPRLANLVYNW
jgi:glycosyltransferase involved in cell wall biosynthesis